MNSLMKKAVLASALSFGLPSAAMADIIITEYVEGSSNNKAVEITNLGSDSVNLGADKYKLALFSGGSATEHVDRKILLTGTLPPGASFVVYNGQAEDQFKFPTKGAESILTFFNGDDSIVLTKDGVVVDSFGQVSTVDPGTEWTDPNNADWGTANRTLRRMASVTTGDAVMDDDFPGATNQWLAFPVDTADGLGCGGEGACATGEGDGYIPAPPALTENVMITEYIEGSGNNKAVEISNMGTDPVDLAEGNYKLAMFRDGSETEHEDRKIFLSGVLEPGKSFVVYNDQAEDQFKNFEPSLTVLSESSSVTWYNGDDALVLTANDVIVDSIGRVGEQPADGFWTDPNDPEFATENKTLRRKVGTGTGDAVVDDAFPGDNNEWAVFPENTADGLGCPGEEPCFIREIPEPIENFILITEYVEGSSNNKAIELSNIGNDDIDLLAEGYRLELYFNGRSTVGNSLNLFGKLPAHSSIVVYNKDIDEAAIKEGPSGIASTVTWFNGDDALVLTKGGVVVDSIGKVGEDPGRSWTDPNDADFNTQNKTIRRKVSVTAGDHVNFDRFPVNDSFENAMNEWVTFDINTFDGLGCMGEAACTGEEPQAMVGVGGGVTTGDCVNCREISKANAVSLFDHDTYYADTIAANRDDLLMALNHDIRARHVPLTYSQVWSVLTFSDEDPDNHDNVIELYTGNSIAKMENGSGDNANNQDSWNREHVWSKSHGFPEEAQTAYTDAHHLRPADWSMNTLRSNLDFDNGGEPVEESPINFKDEDSWEPRSEVKGDVARMMFYMATRYNGGEGEDTPDLVLVDEITNTDTVDGVAKFGKLCTLWEWHSNDPVSDMEMHRNDVVFEYQGNRNPFIDNPFWGVQLFGDACTIPVINITGPAVVEEGDTVTIDASGTTDVDPANLIYHWRQTTGALISFEYDQATITFTAPSTSGDVPINFELTVSDRTNTVTETFGLVVEDTTSDKSVGGSIGFISLLLLPLIAVRRKRQLH